jgi:hypothetical protein
MPLISGRAKAFLDNELDLVALQGPMGKDYITRLLQSYWACQKRRSKDPFDRTTIFKYFHVARVVAVLDVILAAILLVGAIVSLYFASNQTVKLGLVAFFTLLFACTVGLSSSLGPFEVFASTATYAAVLVVFVSSELGGNKSDQCLVQLEGNMWKTVSCPNSS